MAFIVIKRNCTLNGIEQVFGGHAAEHETAGCAVLECCRSAIHYRIRQAAGGVDDGRGAIALAIQLVQSAGFKPRRHDEHIRAGFYLMREPLIKTNHRANLARVAMRQIARGFLHLRIAAAEHGQLHRQFGQQRRDFQQ